MRSCLYSPLGDIALFDRVGFYRDDFNALKFYGDSVIATNSIFDVLSYKPDLVVCYFYSKSFFAGVISRIFGSKVIYTGGADQICPTLRSGVSLYLRKILAFFCLIVSHRVLLSCTVDYDNFKKLAFGLSFLSNKVELVPHIVIPLCAPTQKENYKKYAFNAFTIAWMGSVDNVVRKGVDRAIRLVSLLRNEGIEAQLAIAGTDGPGRIYLESLVSELNLSKFVIFLGAISEQEMRECFLASSIYLQLSEYEGFGVAAAEAFFSGMVVIHSNAGGLKDVIGERGIVINPQQIDASNREAVLKMYNDYLDYTVDEEFLTTELDKYSLHRRAAAFHGKPYV